MVAGTEARRTPDHRYASIPCCHFYICARFCVTLMYWKVFRTAHSFAQVPGKEFDESGDVHDMATVVDVQLQVFRLIEIKIGRTDLLDGIPGHDDIELGGGLLSAVLALKRSGRRHGVDVGEIQ